MSPITRIWGPVVAWNILCLIAPALAAWCAFILCRHLTDSFLPSLIGGYLFGFSPYMLGHMLAHLSLILIFPVPLAIYLVMLGLDGRASRRAFVGLFTIIVLVQFLCCHEVLATMVVFGAIVMAVAMLTMGPLMRGRLLEAGGLTAIALGIAAMVLAPFLYYAFFDSFPKGPLQSSVYFSSDLLAFVVPTRILLLGGPSPVKSMALRLSGGVVEDTAYVGLPLLLLVADYVVVNRRKPEVWLLGITLIMLALASLGPSLHFAGTTTIPSPGAILECLPLINKALPGRFMMFAFLTLSLIVSIYLTTQPHRLRKWFLACLSVVSMAPNLPAGWWFSRADTPRFFVDGSFKQHLVKGEVTLILPYGWQCNSMLWQAQTDMYFRMAGGYLGLTSPEFLSWPVLYTLYRGEKCFDFAQQLKFFLAAHQVRTIILAQDARGTFSTLFEPFQMTRTEVGDVVLYSVPPHWLTAYAGMKGHEAAATANLLEFAAMAAAANEYWAKGLPLQKLTPWEAARLGLLALPPSSTGPDPNGPQWWRNMWLAAWGDSKVGIGLMGGFTDLEAVINKYGSLSRETFFPFPDKFHPGLPANSAGELLLTFDRQSLAQAVRIADHETSPHD